MKSFVEIIVAIVVLVGMGVLCSLLYYLNSKKAEIWEEIYKRLGN